MNDARAVWAGTAVRAFSAIAEMDEAMEPDDTILCELLADLMHYCDLCGVNFDEALRDARVVYANKPPRNDSASVSACYAGTDAGTILARVLSKTSL